MPRLTRRGSSRRVPRRRQSHDRRLPSFLVAISALALSLSVMMAKAPMLSASNGVWVSLDPETANVTLGDTVTLTAQMVDDTGAPVASNTHVGSCRRPCSSR